MNIKMAFIGFFSDHKIDVRYSDQYQSLYFYCFAILKDY